MTLKLIMVSNPFFEKHVKCVIMTSSAGEAKKKTKINRRFARFLNYENEVNVETADECFELICVMRCEEI